jgi:hypothetical protein
MRRYFVTLLGPLAVLLVAAIVVHASGPRLGLGVMLLTLATFVVAPAWGGWLLVVRAKVSPWAAAFCGPALLFIDTFVFGYLPSLVAGRFSSVENHAPDKLILGSPELTLLVGMLVGYALLFPLSLGIAGIGAYIGVRDLRKAAKPKVNLGQ